MTSDPVAETRRAEAKVWSLRRRLLVWLLIATAVMGALALVDTWREAGRTADQLTDRVLGGSALVIAERAGLSDEGVLEIPIPYGALEMLSSAAQDRVFYRIDRPDAGGELVTGYGDLPVISVPPGGGPVFANAVYRGMPVRIATLSRSVSTGIDEVLFTVTMAETTLAREALARDILLRSALRLAGMILGAAAIVWIAVTLSLRPLGRLSEAIAARNPGDLSPVDTPVPIEVRAPVRAVNSLIQRLDDALEGLRNFTGNAAHQLRTPMTVIGAELALAGRIDDPVIAEAAMARARAALARAERVLAQLLALARVDAAQGWGPGGETLAPVDLVPVIRDLTAGHIPAAAKAGVDLGFETEGTASRFARAEPLLLGEALHNLISNAVLHAGRGCLVTVRLRDVGDAILIEVEDNGPGIPEAARAGVMARVGQSGAGASPRGMGLGLPVVHEIARLFGGRLKLANGENGKGVRAQLFLPAISGATCQPAAPDTQG